ncbi:hypothetical protein PR048_025487 [Dryococelus australis]|uniref:Uncharacterized protein n=1 Tax=Dryococelus australis TaxID=614101 RepID=A0ABQ9GRF3_9NEOP|nr:hypothetical protein PR048_025487 [Dryococelus australis]
MSHIVHLMALTRFFWCHCILNRDFSKILLRNGAGFLYLREKFPRVSDAKIKEGIYVGINIIVFDLLQAYKQMKCNIFFKINFLLSHLDFVPDCLGVVEWKKALRFLLDTEEGCSKYTFHRKERNRDGESFHLAGKRKDFETLPGRKLRITIQSGRETPQSNPVLTNDIEKVGEDKSSDDERGGEKRQGDAK